MNPHEGYTVIRDGGTLSFGSKKYIKGASLRALGGETIIVRGKNMGLLPLIQTLVSKHGADERIQGRLIAGTGATSHSLTILVDDHRGNALNP